jgi:hypothetical protein
MSTLDYLSEGEARARRELELAADASLSAAERGVALKYAVAAALGARPGGMAAIRAGMREGSLDLPGLRAQALEELASLLDAARRAGWAEHLERPELQARMVELAIDALLSERLAPEVLLEPESRALPDAPVHALVFSAFTHCTHELYPLLVDALSAGAQAVGAHESWIAEGKLRRAMLLDAEADRLLEADLDPPAPVASAQVLALDLTREVESHQQIERALPGVPFTNSYAGARFLDDKVWTAATWANAGLNVPAYLTFAPGTPDGEMRTALADWLCTHDPKLVVKPADGTEGRGVALIDFAEAEGRANCFVRLHLLIGQGPALVMEERGMLRYASPWGPVRFAFRLNVCWDGEQAWAESGYAQAAGDPSGIASAGRGGRVAPLHEVWGHLQRPDGLAFAPDTESWETVTHAAEAGVAVLAQALGPSMPRLIGLDLLLDLEDDRIVPVLLEANPRPAGMSHARFVTAAGPTREPGVTRRLWRTF